MSNEGLLSVKLKVEPRRSILVRECSAIIESEGPLIVVVEAMRGLPDHGPTVAVVVWGR